MICYAGYQCEFARFGCLGSENEEGGEIEMKRFIVLLAWWFLMAGASSSFSTEVFVVVGPFKERAICEQMVTAVKGRAAFVSVCWEG